MSEVHTGTQFSVFLVNKPGILAQVTRALADEKIAALLAGKEIMRIIVVPRKLINIVVK